MNVLILSLAVLFVQNTIAQEFDLKKDGEYRLTTNIHLINDLAYKSNNQYQVLVEIPTGSRQKWEVNHKTGQLEWEFKHNHPRNVNFLGYPGNYGFIPQTLSGDNDPLDIIVLSESSQRGALVKVKIIGMLVLKDSGESDNKVIAITDNGAFSGINSLNEMMLKQPNVITIIRQWFTGYKKPGKMIFMGYKDKSKTVAYIEKTHQNWLTKTGS